MNKEFIDFWKLLGPTYNELEIRTAATDDKRNIFVFIAPKSKTEGSDRLLRYKNQFKALKIELGFVKANEHGPRLFEDLESDHIGETKFSDRPSIKLHNTSKYTYKYTECAWPAIEILFETRQMIREKISSTIQDELQRFGFTRDDLLRWLSLNRDDFSLEAIFQLPIYIRISDLKIDPFSGIVTVDLEAHKNLILPSTILRIGDKDIPLGQLEKLEEKESIVKLRANQKVGVGLGKISVVHKGLLGKVAERDFNMPSEDAFLKTFLRFVQHKEFEGLLVSPQTITIDRFDDSTKFELGVRWLFSVLGFKVIDLSTSKHDRLSKDKKHIGGCDMIVEDIDKKTVFVVGCQLGTVSNQDINKIQNVASELKKTGIITFPVIMTNERIPTKNTLAIPVLDKSDFDELILLLGKGDIISARGHIRYLISKFTEVSTN